MMTAKDHFETGLEFYEIKNYEQALVSYEKAIELDDNYSAPWNGKGDIYDNLAKYDNALSCYDKAIQINEMSVDAWNGKGNVYRLIGDYTYALECFNKALEFDSYNTTSWNGKGNIFAEQKDYERALDCFDKVLGLNENHIPSLNGKGNVYTELEEYKKALNCFDKAIQIDKMYVNVWNGKGKVYFELKEYDRALVFFSRTIYLENGFTSNFIALTFLYPNAPFFTYDVLKMFIRPQNYNQWRNLITLTIDQSKHLLAYIGYLELTGKNQILEQWQWYQWLGIVYYYMGHTIKSYKYLKKVIAIQPKDLMSYYYMILSCRGFAQPETKYLERALNIAKQIKPSKNRFDFFGKKSVLSSYELQQTYYAGQLLCLNQKYTEAFSYFESIKNDFLPAAYMCFELKDGASSKHAKEIIRGERKVLGTSESFLSGFPEQNLDLELEDFRIPFFKYARYYEIKIGIGLLEYEISDADFKDFEPVFPDALKAFWYTWHLSSIQYQQIFEIARKEGARRRADEILKVREQVIGFTAAEVEQPKEKNAAVIDQTESAKLRAAYNLLKEISPPKELEKQIGEKLNDWTLPRAAHYRKLTSILFLEDKLDESQKIYLDFFSVLQEYARKKPSDLLIAGEKDIVKVLVGIAFDKLLDDEQPIGQLLDVFMKPFAKGSIAELIAKWRKQPNPKYKTYSEFRKNFREFIGEEQKRLGDDFEKQYPLFGFEEWIE